MIVLVTVGVVVEGTVVACVWVCTVVTTVFAVDVVASVTIDDCVVVTVVVLRGVV